MVLAQSLFLNIKQHNPDIAIDVLAPRWTLPIVRRMPEVRGAIENPLAHGEFALRKRFRLAQALRGEIYDQAIVLPNSWKSALVPFLAGIPRRSGYRGEFRFGLLNDVRILDKARLPRMVDRFVALADTQASGVPIPQLAYTEVGRQATLAALDLCAAGPIVALCVGAEFGPAKRWPPEHFAALAKILARAGWQCWVVGSDKDQLIASEVVRLSQSTTLNLCGKTTLDQAVDVLASADVVVANDSGLMHIAAALGKPLIALYGSSSPAFTPPLAPNAIIIKRDLPCSPCFARECPLGHFNCMRELDPHQVAQAVLEGYISKKIGGQENSNHCEYQREFNGGGD